MNRTILTAIGLLALLASCESADGTRMRAMIGGGLTNMDVEFGGAEGSMDEGQGSLRVELSQRLV